MAGDLAGMRGSSALQNSTARARAIDPTSSVRLFECPYVGCESRALFASTARDGID